MEIAHAFLTSEDTITKRIYRAKEKIKEEQLSLEAPVKTELISRIDNVLKVLYLLFNEGYNSSHPDILVREDLCEEAMRLNYLLIQNKETNLPKARALMALMCLQAARFPSRVNEAGVKVLLQDQNRSKWNQPLTQRGLDFLRGAFSGDQLTEYHVEAAIASVHSVASHFSETNWKELLKLYETLSEMKPSPMVELNKAIALGYALTPLKGIQALKKIKGLEDHYLYLASLGNFYAMAGDHVLAQKFFGEAMTRTTSNSEIELLRRKIESCKN
jgi:RNA polymerase sigma-70 factor (ECF subfamily)